jgi:hypothetical protein
VVSAAEVRAKFRRVKPLKDIAVTRQQKEDLTAKALGAPSSEKENPKPWRPLRLGG